MQRVDLLKNAAASGWRSPGRAVLLLLLLGAAPAVAQHGVVGLPSSEGRLPEDHSPQGALWRAAAFPGWGQYYNRQYYKIPVVYLGLGGLTAFSLHLNSQYLVYRHAYLYKAWAEQVALGRAAENPYAHYEPAYERIVGGRDIGSSQLKPIRDIFRRNRDLSYLGIGLFYGLTILDAYVSAHLLDFDVGEDLTVRLLAHPEGLAATVRLGF